MSWLVGHDKAMGRRQCAGLGLGRQMPKREPQEFKLFRRGRKQEIGLVTCGIGRRMKFRPQVTGFTLNIMPGCHAVGVKILCRCQKVLELHPLVAADTGNRCRARQITVGEFVDHRITKDILVIQNVMGKAHVFGHPAGVVNVDTCTAGTFLGQSRAVVIKLKRHANHVIAFAGQFGGHDRTVDAPRHCHDNTGLRRRFRKPEGIQVFAAIKWHGADP